MALLDFVKDHNAGPQPSVAQNQQPEAPAQRSVESLPANVKAEAVEAARPAAELMEKASTPRTSQSQPQVQDTPNPSRGRGLGMER